MKLKCAVLSQPVFSSKLVTKLFEEPPLKVDDIEVRLEHLCSTCCEDLKKHGG